MKNPEKPDFLSQILGQTDNVIQVDFSQTTSRVDQVLGTEIVLEDDMGFFCGSRDQIENSQMVGCYSCLEIFPSEDVKNYTVDEFDDQIVEKGLCPCCEADALAGDSGGKIDLANDLETLKMAMEVMAEASEQFAVLEALSMGNREFIEQSEMAGCYNCERLFSASEVTTFVEEEDVSETACCPYCGDDTVIGDIDRQEQGIDNFFRELEQGGEQDRIEESKNGVFVWKKGRKE